MIDALFVAFDIMERVSRLVSLTQADDVFEAFLLLHELGFLEDRQEYGDEDWECGYPNFTQAQRNLLVALVNCWAEAEV